MAALGGGIIGCSDDGQDPGTGGAGGAGGNPSGGTGGTGGTGAGGDGTGGSGGAPVTPLGEIHLQSWRNSSQALTWIYPRPDAETEPHARHRRAPAGIPWTIPLGVVGGGFPYNFEILSGPPDLVVAGVGFDTGRPPFYVYLSLADPDVGSYPISLRATDQNGDSVTCEFNLEVLAADDTSAFLFFDSNSGNNDNPGTPSSPKADINGWYLGNDDDATFHDRQCFYQGTFAIGGVPGVPYDAGVALPVSGGKPKTHVGHGSGATWQGNGGFVNLEEGEGFYFGDLTYEDPVTVDTNGNTRLQHFKGGHHLGAIFRVTFLGSDTQPSDSSNSSCIMLPAPDGSTSYHCFVGCVADGIHHQSLFKNYRGWDGLFEGWTVRNCSGIDIIHHKGGDIERFVTRGVLAVENNVNCRFQNDQWINDPIDHRYDIEICWCSFSSEGAGRFVGGLPGSDDLQRIDSYRNNWRVAYHELSGIGSGTVTFEDEVLQHAGTEADGIHISNAPTPALTDNVVETANLLDPVTNLRVGGPDGEHGCEMVFVMR